MPVNSNFRSLFRNCTMWVMLGGCWWWSGAPLVEAQTRQTAKAAKWAELEALLRKNAVKRITPEYPPLPKNQRLSGDVLVEVTIDPDGNVIATRRLKGHPVLYQASEWAAKQWRFRPFKDFSEPVDASKPLVGALTFRFTL